MVVLISSMTQLVTNCFNNNFIGFIHDTDVINGFNNGCIRFIYGTVINGFNNGI